MRQLLFLTLLIIALPFVAAELDNYFSVKDNYGPYEVLPGESLVVDFTLSNRDLLHPKNVTAYIDPCPVGWTCEQNTFSFNESGTHDVNLTVDIPETALPKKYTLYILLDSEDDTLRGNDRFVVTVLSEKMRETISYEEYVAEKPLEPEEEKVVIEEPVQPVQEPEPAEELIEETVEPEPVPEPEEQVQNKSELMEDVERLESSRQFVEYASIVLLVVLVFVAAGACYSFKKKE